MSLLKRAGDLVYTFRFLRLLTMSFEDTEAYKLGLIDAKGKKLKSPETDAEKSVYSPFHRLVFNIKKLIPGGKIGSYASALYLIKDNFNVSESQIEKALYEMGIHSTDLMVESSQWFLLEDKRLSPGVYSVVTDKVLNATCEEIVKAKDNVRIDENAYPVGSIFGIDIYEAIHIKTKQKVYVSAGELRV